MDVQEMTAPELVDQLLAESLDAQKEAICELRLRAKRDNENRACIADAGAIPLVADYLTSSDSVVQENAVTCLLNLSIIHDCKREIIANSRCLDGIVEAVKLGKSAETRQNAAATLFSLLILEEVREYVGSKTDVILALLDLLDSDVARSRKDAIKALFHLCLCQVNKARVVKAGVVPLLMSFIRNRERLTDSKEGKRCTSMIGAMVNNSSPLRDVSSSTPVNLTTDYIQDKSQERKRDSIAEDALALLGLLAGSAEGVDALMKACAVSLLVELLEPQEYPRCRENATSTLLAMCQTGGDDVVQEVLQCNFCISALCGVLSSGSSRARSKAGALLQLLMVNDRS
ncbi:hypothetical protein O6H91_08G044300 [Diphasiastrum complanatum]|uniref:Uncharacterized protein n=1 Tax=Diphasiastrum complanatum TaxID=34168 RepID=A0ACC2CWY8_DIPCM|nr:hypothetical protein O6H91_Y462100 [Diphasiastrum complanatum]KAJ7546551.1 hypothetical protein O6H91_08G044300 [Diphasiastrum complanatum]